MRLKRVSRGSHAPSPESKGSTQSSEGEPALSIEQIVTLSPESVAAMLAGPVDDVPGSLEALFHEVADDALPDWQSVSVAPVGVPAQAFRNLAMAPFAGGPVTVTKTVRLQ